MCQRTLERFRGPLGVLHSILYKYKKRENQADWLTQLWNFSDMPWQFDFSVLAEI
jgi:hypothetical protein